MTSFAENASTNPPVTDIGPAYEFLERLDPFDTSFTFQSFDDAARKDNSLARIIHGSLIGVWRELCDLNARGAGVFVTVNRTDLQGRATANITGVRGVWADLDKGLPDRPWPIEPSTVVMTSPGRWQVHWFADGLTVDDHAAVMARMVADYRSDPAAKALAQVLRLPGLNHRKGEPFLVRVDEDTGKRYTRAEVLQAFGLGDRAAVPPPADAPQKPAERPAAPLCEPDLEGALADGWRLVNRTPGMGISDEAEGPFGKVHGRNNMTHHLAGKLKRLGVSVETATDMVLRWNARCDPQPDEDVRKTVASCYVNGDWPIGKDRPEAEFNPIGDAGAGKTGAAPGVDAQQLLERVSDIDLAELARRRANALIKGILHPRDDATLYGRSTAGKSHVGVHVSYHVALGLPWAGRKVKRAPVLYICLEGVDGFRERMLAAAKAYGDPGKWFARLTVPVTLDKTVDGAAGGKVVVDAAKRLEADCGQPVGLIIVDTRARATPGDDEIKAADIMAYARRVAEIARDTGAAMLTIDHTNEGGELRGAKTKGAAADVILEAVRNDDGTERAVIAKKIKDGVEMPLFDFTIRAVPLGVDDDGDAFGSAVIETTAPKAKDATPTLSSRNGSAAPTCPWTTWAPNTKRST